MVKIIDPVFLQAIARLKEDKPQNYNSREINLYNDGKDALQQEIIATGNVLQVLDFPEFCNIKIQFNEPTNPAITLRKGIYLFNFYRFFLTYEHIEQITDLYGNLLLLKLLISKELISATEPVKIKKDVKEIIEGSSFTITVGAGKQILSCPREDGSFYFWINGYNQLRGIAKQTHTSEKKLYIKQDVVGNLFLESEVIIPPNEEPVEFFIDLVGEVIRFYVEKDSSDQFGISLYCKLWCM